MSVLPIGDNVFEVGASHPDRELFDCLMPLPHGTTYNSYLIVGSEKTALIDAVDPEKTDVLLSNLKEAGVTKLDYLICLHTEQDHSGSIPAVLARYPMAQLVATSKVRDFLAVHLNQDPAQVLLAEPGQELSLGNKTLRFMPIPFAHWPDNTMVWLVEEKILFSSDLFGSHFATDKAFATTSAQQRLAAKSYYAEIMMPFRAQVSRYTAQAREILPRLIAPAHGPVWYDPNIILSRYEKWTSDGVKKVVAIPYISMHDSTRVIVERLAVKLAAQGLSVIIRDLGGRLDSLTLETGHFIMDLVDAAAMILATPTVLGGPHPNMAYAAIIANAVRPKTRFMSLVGSYGWATQVEKTMSSLTANIKAERLDSLLVHGLPTAADIAKIDELAVLLGDKISNLPDLMD